MLLGIESTVTVSIPPKAVACIFHMCTSATTSAQPSSELYKVPTDAYSTMILTTALTKAQNVAV
jgi:hypothetical protein